MLQNQSKENRKTIGLGLGLAISLLVMLLAAGGVFEDLELKFLDVQHRWRGETSLSKAIVVVDIDDSSLEELGWPVPRVVYASLINALGKAGAQTIGVDLLLSDPGQDLHSDQLLALSAKMHGRTIFPLELRFNSSLQDQASLTEGVTLQGDLRLPAAQSYQAPQAELLDASHGLAHMHLDNRPDGVFRRVPLLVDVHGKKLPALALQMILSAVGVSKEPLQSKEGWLYLPQGKMLTIPPIPVDTQGRALIDFRSMGKKVQAYPLREIVAAIVAPGDSNLDLKEIFAQKLVLIGTSAASLGDLGATPFSNSAPLLLVHANILDNLLHGRFLIPHRQALNLAIIFFIGFCLAVFGAYLSQLWGALMGLTLLGGYVGLSQLFFRQGLFMPVLGPLLCGLLVYLVLTIYNHYVRDVDERLYRAAFKSYVAPHILERIVENPELLAVQGQRKELTLLFSDVKGYTSLSNTRPAKEVLDLLHEYLETMVQVVFRYEGTVDKIMGDGLMVFFGDPLPQKDHAKRAVRCAQNMLKELKALQKTWRERDLPDLEIRVGIATGEVFVGNIGSSQHLEYTAIGPSVNLAARLESNSRPGRILISEETHRQVSSEVYCRPIANLQLKGYKDGYTAYEVAQSQDDKQDAPTHKNELLAPKSKSFDVTVVTAGLNVPAEVLSWTPEGMLLRSRKAFAVGERLDLVARLPVERQALPLEATISICSTRADKDGYTLLESKFDKVSVEHRDSIAFFVGQALHKSGLEFRADNQNGVPFSRYDVSEEYRQLLIQDKGLQEETEHEA